MKQTDSFLTPQVAGEVMSKWMEILSRVFPDCDCTLQLDLSSKKSKESETKVYLWGRNGDGLVSNFTLYTGSYHNNELFSGTIHEMIDGLSDKLREKHGYKYKVNKNEIIDHEYIESIVNEVYEEWKSDSKPFRYLPPLDDLCNLLVPLFSKAFEKANQLGK